MNQIGFWHDFGLAWIAFLAIASVVYRQARGKPIIPRVPADAVFSEFWASGRSGKNGFTKIAGANNCLLVALTPDYLLVCPFFPFDLFFMPDLFDLEHRIPQTAIRSVTERRRFFKRALEVAYDDGAGRTSSVELYLRNPDKFREAIGSGR